MAPCIDLVSDSSSDNSSDSSSGSELRHYKTCIHGIKQLALRGKINFHVEHPAMLYHAAFTSHPAMLNFLILYYM